MSTQSEAKAPGATGGEKDEVLAAVLFELDGVALGTRKVVHDAAASALRKARSELTPALFARHGVTGSPQTVARELAERSGVTSLSASDLAQALTDKLAAFLASEHAVLAPGLDKLLKAAANRGLPAAALTALPEEMARGVMDRLGLTERGVRLFSFKDDEKPFPRAEAWLKAAKGLGRPARFCVAVTSSQASCKTALSAGLRCVAVPDLFTGHHDFGGADVIVDQWDDVSASELLDCVAPAVH